MRASVISLVEVRDAEEDIISKKFNYWHWKGNF